jgi:hypothetical protein
VAILAGDLRSHRTQLLPPSTGRKIATTATILGVQIKSTRKIAPRKLDSSEFQPD